MPEFTKLTEAPRAGYFPGETLPKNWGKWIDKEDLSIWDWNPPRRQLSDGKYRETRASLAQDGQVMPVVVQFQLDRTPRLVDGNRRLRAADELGWRQIWAVELPITKDAAHVTAVLNMKVRGWTTHELIMLAQHDPKVLAQLNPGQQQLYHRLIREVPEDIALEFAGRYGTSAVNLLARIADYTGSTLAHIARYVVSQPPGVMHQMRLAIWTLRIPSHRLKFAVEENVPPEEWWAAEPAEEVAS